MPASSTPTNSPPEDAAEPPSRSGRLQVSILVDEGLESPVSEAAVRAAVTAAAHSRDCLEGEIGVRITGDAGIREINRRHLNHDYATDVISFGYLLRPPAVEGELIVSAETAEREAAARQDAKTSRAWTAADELLLYVVHGVLHVTGMRDADAAGRHAMRQAEQAALLALGVDQIRHFGADSDRPADHAGSEAGT